MLSCLATDDCVSPCDLEIVETIRACLRRSPYPMIRNVSCEYDQGTLVLRGKLPSFYHKQLTQAMVAGLPGVAQIVNLTEVVGAGR